MAAYLTALAHPSSEQWVLQAHVQTSTGNTDVCRHKPPASGRKQTHVKEVPALLTSDISRMTWTVESGVNLMISAGVFERHNQGRVSVSFRLLFLSTTVARVQSQSILPQRTPPTPSKKKKPVSSCRTQEETSLTFYAADLLSHFMNESLWKYSQTNKIKNQIENAMIKP